MIFHQIDRSLTRLTGCLKRAEKLAQKGSIDKDHPLFVQYSNFIWYCDGKEARVTVDDVVQSLIGLDWFASKIDEYAKGSILAGDKDVSAMLYEWRERMPFRLPKKKK